MTRKRLLMVNLLGKCVFSGQSFGALRPNVTCLATTEVIAGWHLLITFKGLDGLVLFQKPNPNRTRLLGMKPQLGCVDFFKNG